MFRKSELYTVSLYLTGSLAYWVECSPMVRETWVQSQVSSYQRRKKWYLIPPCLTFSDIRYVSRVKWSNPGKGVAHYPTPRCSCYWKGSLLFALDNGRQLSISFLPSLSVLLWPTFVLLVRIQSIIQILLLKNYSYSVGPCAQNILKKYQHKECKYTRTTNSIL